MFLRFTIRFAFTLAILIASTAAYSQTPAVLKIETDKPISKVSPELYGLMTEEINYSYDGGLYAELIRNRTFHADWSGIQRWYVVEQGNSSASIQADKTTGPSAALPFSVKLTVRQADSSDRAGLENEGYWGILVTPNTEYKGSFYAKSEGNPAVTVRLVDDFTGKAAAESVVPAVTGDWKKYDFTLNTGNVAPGTFNHLVLTVDKPATIWFSLASLFPPAYMNQPNGFRIDLMDKLAAMHPKFLRFPGGNYLEGDHINERFEWKKTIGPLVDRPTHRSPWGYQSTDGMGLLEFLRWCEDLHMQPVLAVYAGYSLQQEHVNPGPDLEPYVQDALDEIEYVTGGPDTKWGAERIKDGHAAPFPLKYVEIGNEDMFDKSGSYEDRYAQFYKAIKAKYPDLQLIATMPIKNMRPDVIDDHFYKRKEEFFNDTTHYDKTDRNGPKIFVGERATREGSPTPNFGAALGDAAWMTGLERNSDIVIMASYAPLLVNVNPGGMQWESDLIGYNAASSYGSPSYYVQVMFSSYLGDETVASNLTGAGSRFFYSATRDAQKGKLYLKLVNGSSLPQDVNLQLAGSGKIGSTATLVSLHALTNEATNTILEPTKIVPVKTQLRSVSADFHHTVPGYSIEVLDIDVR
ncbi:MAG TPA: alpha-L-arabinofuranosidase C-terminal domain-containing protein [Silvibacterium sp.]|nr:alpha-L-arabinofuranosidase C-terminal domain-containing protein [Silvibacterium sp.]